jgi:uncharacterized protein (DUF1810 family)
MIPSLFITMTSSKLCSYRYCASMLRWRRHTTLILLSMIIYTVVVQVDCLQSLSEDENIPSVNRVPKLQRNIRSISEALASRQQQPHRLLENEPFDNRASEALLSDDTNFNELSDDEFVEEMFDKMFGPMSDDSMNSNTTDFNETDDEFIDEMLDELLGTNATNGTAIVEEIFDELLDEIFGPIDGNSTNSTTVVGGFMDEFPLQQSVDEIFDIPTDDAFLNEPESQGLSLSPSAAPIASHVDSDVSPALLNSTDDTGEVRDGDNDAPKSPLVRTSPISPIKSSTSPPRPVSSPTETPTMEQVHDNDQKDSQTEPDVDDDLFNEEAYKSRPGGTLPGGSSVTAILGTLAALAAMIFTAWQVSDNPDGIYASMCRLILTSIQLVFRVVMSPCRKYLPCCFSYRGHMAGSNGYHEPYGHIPVSTMDYGYKDPALELT